MGGRRTPSGTVQTASLSGPVTLEPTESYSKTELDRYASIMEHISKEAYDDLSLVKGSPYNSTIGKMSGHSYLDDPNKWAITWRAYKRKYSGYFEPKER